MSAAPQMPRKRPSGRARWTRVLVGPAIAAGMIVAATGCGGPASAAGNSSSAPEKPDITIGVVPAVANAGLYISAMHGFFSAQGLHVKLVPIVSSADVLATLLNGSVDILAGNYVSEIQAEANNPGAVQLRVLAEGSLTAPQSRGLMVASGSPIKTLAQLKDKTVAVNALNNAASLLVESALVQHGIPANGVHLVAIPFQNEAAALNAHQVDAAWMTEPFISIGEAKYGLTSLYDTNQGATSSFAIDGFVSTQAWARKYPKTAAAFIRGIDQGQQLANTSRPDIDAAMVKFLGVTPTIATVITPDTYPIGVSRVRMQRVADLMLEFGLLKRSFKVTPMTG